MRGKIGKRTRSHDKSLQSKHRKNAGKSVQENAVEFQENYTNSRLGTLKIIEDQISFEIIKVG